MAAAHRREIRRTKPVNDALHAARLVEVPALALKFLDVARRAEQRHQVAASRRAPDADVVGVDVMLGGVGSQPADRRFAVLDLCREDGVLAEAVIDARHGVALSDQEDGRAVVLAARRPTAAMNPADQRQPALGLFGQVQVEVVPLVAAWDILDIPQDLDTGRELGAAGCFAFSWETAKFTHARIIARAIALIYVAFIVTSSFESLKSRNV